MVDIYLNKNGYNMIQTTLSQAIITQNVEEAERWKRLSEDSITGLTAKDKAQYKRLKKKLILNEV